MVFLGEAKDSEQRLSRWLREGARRLGTGAGAAQHWLRDLQDSLEPLAAWTTNNASARFISRSLRRRIIISNIAGLAFLVLGWTVLSQQNVWLIDAKRDALETQSRMIAAAIASSGKNTFAESADYDPDRLASIDADPFTFDEQAAFKDLDLSIRPERIAPVLAQVVKDTSTRARLYAADGTPLVDSDDFDLRHNPAAVASGSSDNPVIKPKNIWTRALSWRVQSPLTVYQDIEDINGFSFREVGEALRDGKSRALLLMTSSGEQVVAYATPIIRLGKIEGALMLSTRPGEIDDLLSEERLRIFALAILAFGATLVASLLLARTVAGPMQRLSAAAEQVSVDINASSHLPVFEGREDEIGQLARSFSKMTDSLRRRIEASEKFAADVAHELKNPLTAARSTAESLTYAKTDAQRDELVRTITSELQRLNRLITDVSNASRLDAELARQQTEVLDLRDIAQNVVATFRDLISEDPRNLKIEFVSTGAPGRSLILGHDGRIGQVLTNLIDNALSFSPTNGTVRVALTATGQGVRIAVEDQGPGIEPDKLETIFSRFYTYRPTEFSSRGSNSGLGLSISREIVKAHRGEIWAENKQEGGARFTVQFPAAQAPRKGASRTHSFSRNSRV